MSRLPDAILALAALATLAVPAAAQEYPTRPIKIIAPFGAGGPGDVFTAACPTSRSASICGSTCGAGWSRSIA